MFNNLILQVIRRKNTYHIRHFYQQAILICLLISGNVFAQNPIIASPDVSICAPNTTTLSAAVNPQSRATTSYLISTIPYSPDPFTTGNQVYLSDDQFTGVLNIGFNFCFYGISYNQVLISSNNYLSFDLTNANGFSPWSIPGPVPSAMNPMNTVLGPWQDINPGVGGQIYYNIAGVAPFRRFVASYLNIPMFSCTGLLYSSQIILYETTNIIETHILNKPLCTSWNSGQAIHALHNNNGTLADVVTGRNAPIQWTSSNEGTRFTPNGALNYTINWLVNNVQVGTGPTLTVSPTQTTHYVAQLIYGCTNATFTDTVIVTAASNTPTPISGQTTVCPSDTATYTVPFSPTATYTWSTSNAVINSGQGSNQLFVTWGSSGTGNISVQISDNGCNSTGTLQVTIGQVQNVSFTGLGSVYCFNFIQVNLSGTPMGGTFSGPGINNNQFNPLNAGAGTHAIVYSVTSPGNCSPADTQWVQVISPITGNTISGTQQLCAPASPALISGSLPSGGTGIYTYQWQSDSGNGWTPVSGGTNQHLLPSGIQTSLYRRVVSGASPCPAVNSTALQIIIQQPLSNNTVSGNQTLCSSQIPSNFTGSLPNGGSGTYTYYWQSSADLSNWSAADQPNSGQNYTSGTISSTRYFRRIVFSGVCPSDTSNTLSVFIYLQTSLTVNGDIICEGQTATLTALGNPAGGTYLWNTNPPQTSSVITVSPMTHTTYTVQYSISGCNATDSAIVMVYPLPAPQIQVSGNLSFCSGDSVVLSAFPGGGTYLWSDGSVTQSIRVLQSGTYSVQLTDGNGCPGASSPVITQEIDNPIVNILAQGTSCSGFCDGKAEAFINGGLGPYSYTWLTSPVQSTNIATGICAGTYLMQVQDAIGCTGFSFFTISSPPVLSLSTSATDVSCYGQGDGQIIITGSGGTGSYLYSLNNQPYSTNPVFSGLNPGTYQAIVRDANFCTAQMPITIQQPLALTATITYTSPLCFGDANGSAQILVSGGTPAYTYVWSTNSSSGQIQNLTTGTYFINVTDSRNCQTQAQVFIAEPDILFANASGFDLTCDSPPENGIGSVFVTGGTTPYSYLWNAGNNLNASYNTGMPAGTWQVQVQDFNGCLTSASLVLTAPEYPSAFTHNDTFFCSGTGGAPVSGWGTGGNAPYTYLWSPNNGSISNAASAYTNVNPDTSTTYYFQVIDDAGCASELVTQKVTVYALPVVDAGLDQNYCENGPAVFITGNIVSPPGSYDVWWTPSNGLYCDTCLSTYAIPGTHQIYTLYARNRQTGCQSDSTTLNTLSSVVVSVNPRPVAYAGLDTSICHGGDAMLCGTAGNYGPLYTWHWQPATFLSDSSAQCPIASPDHTFTWFLVTESGGCFSIADSVTVFVSLLPEVDAGNIRNICRGDSVELQGQVQSGIGQQYRWFPGAGLNDSTLLKPIASPAQNIWYYLQAYNQGCAGPVDSVQVLVHEVPIAYAGRDTLVCGEDVPVKLEGVISYTGNQPVYVSWEPGGYPFIQPTVQTSSSQMYVMEVRAGVAPNQCTSYDSMLISVLPAVELSLEADTQIICPGMSVQLKASAGIGSAGYFWTPDPDNMQQGQAEIEVRPQISTTYTLIADESGCRDTASVSIWVHPKVQAFFNPSQLWGCAPFELKFQNLSMGALSYVWNFGDQSPYSNEKEPSHMFDSTGVYPISLVAIGMGGCRDTMVYELPVRTGDSLNIQVFISPEAPVELVLPMASIQLHQTGADQNTESRWYLGDGNMRIGDEITYTYGDTGTYFIHYQAEHAAGCRTEKILGPVIIKAAEINIPNVFSPNGDGINDYFLVEYSGDELFYLVIYDRWGVKCFETNNSQQGWDGRDLNGKAVSEGVYFYSVEMGKRKDIGSFTLLR